MQLLKNNFAIALALTIWFSGTSALADYMPPRQVESYMVMSSDWSIDEKDLLKIDWYQIEFVRLR